MGSVFLAQHPRLPRQDALKILSGGLTSDPAFRARFEREADVVARLRHPNIVSVHDRGHQDRYLWIAMQYVEGPDAAELISAGPGTLSVPRVIAILRDVAKAVDYAHRQGLLHRDLKPANILVTQAVHDDATENALLTDFGIARAAASANRALTQPGDLLGTYAYSSPEQLRGAPVDHRADIYSLGCTFYEMLTGAKPFPRDTAPAMLHAQLTAPPPRVTEVRPDLPTDIDAVIARAMAKYPGYRHNTCRELVEDAARALQVPDPSAPQPFPFFSPPTPPRRRRPLAIVAAVLAVLVLVAAGVVGTAWWLNRQESPPPPPTAQPPPPPPPAPEEPTVPTAQASDESFSVSLLPGWQEVDPGPQLLTLGSETAAFGVSETPEQARGRTVEDSARQLAQGIATNRQYRDIDLGDVTATEVDGEEAWQFVYTFTDNNGPSRVKTLLVRHGRAEYLVVFLGTPEVFDRKLRDFDIMRDSWKWSD